MKWFARSMLGMFGWLISLGFTLIIIGAAASVLIFTNYSSDLPDHSQLSAYDPPTVTRLYAADGKLLAEYATEKRVFVPLKAVPRRIIQAFLSAEDKNFYAHTGIDITGIIRAVRDNIVNYGQGKSLVGGSTITQQVVKNFLLSSEKSMERKIKEAILATRISRVYSKDKILELYLNEIYLGMGSYGVAAAAQSYFNKSLDELSVEEAAMLAALPKAPAAYNPHKHYEQAKQRRDWVLDRMRDGGYLTAEENQEAKKTAIVLHQRGATEIARAEFFAEEVRRWLAEQYGAGVLYQGGLVVKTTLDPELQKMADQALQLALIDYDRRRGYRGPLARQMKAETRKEELTKLTKQHAFHLREGQRLAMVTSLDDRKVQIVFEDDSQGTIPFALMGWTRRVISDGVLGPDIRRPGDILKTGDVVMVGLLSAAQKKLLTADDQKRAWDLQQVPEVNGGLVAIDPHTGRVLAMSGGYSYGGTEFNRVTQAKRQPGSAFKPFVYLAGLESGFTPSTIILDAPVEMSQGEGLPTWKPQNYGDEYLGPTTMRVGLEKSRNTMTVRLAQIIGINKVIDVARRFGIYDRPPRHFSIVLGAAETTLLKLSNAYGMIVNGGKEVTPSFIERIDDRHGKTIYRRDTRECPNCTLFSPEQGQQLPPPMPVDNRRQVADPRIAYQMISMLQGVTIRGTGARAREIGKIVAGKTGTTNNSMDTWFVGFTPDLVVGVYVGYDQPHTLGLKETGASVALPAFISFLKDALKDTPNTPFRVPRGIQLARVSLTTGLPLTGMEEEGERIVEEAFITGQPIYIPGVSQTRVEGGEEIIINPEGIDRQPMTINPAAPGVPRPAAPPPTAPVIGTGGLY